MTVCKESVIEDDDATAGSVVVGSGSGVTGSGSGGGGSLPQRQHHHPPQQQLLQAPCNNNTINGHAGQANNNNSRKQINLSLPLESYKQYGGNCINSVGGGGGNKDVDNNFLQRGGGGGFSPNNNSNGLAINSTGASGGGGGGGCLYSSITGGGGTEGGGDTFSRGSISCAQHNNNHHLHNNNNCARSCSDVFNKRHSFSLRLDMSPATDGGDGGSRKALFSPEENMEVRKRRYDSSACGDKEPRLVLKTGVLNAQEVNVEEKGQRYFADFFTSLVDMRWRWTMFYFCIVYVLSWLGFAVIWWTILKSHGDMEHFEEEDWKPCVVGVQSFSSVFLFSLESQHTIGYGYHRMTDVCPEAIALLSLQSIAGVLIEAISVGVFIVKISKPKKRSQTLIFSKNALVCQKDGQMFLKFRLADIRHESKLLETHVRAQVVYKKTAPDGEVESIVQKELTVGAQEEDEDRILLYWPTTIVHEITEDSPFYDMSCDDLTRSQAGNNGFASSDWEMIAVLEGVVESTGMTTQARTSYLPSEILWGRKFRSMMRSKGNTYVVDFDLFNSTISCDDTPLCSAKTWYESQGRHRDSSSSSSSSSSSTGSGDHDAAAVVDGVGGGANKGKRNRVDPTRSTGTGANNNNTGNRSGGIIGTTLPTDSIVPVVGICGAAAGSSSSGGCARKGGSLLGANNDTSTAS